nr:probable galacturonosyltransferase 6 [Ipomoea batatas]
MGTDLRNNAEQSQGNFCGVEERVLRREPHHFCIPFCRRGRDDKADPNHVFMDRSALAPPRAAMSPRAHNSGHRHSLPIRRRHQAQPLPFHPVNHANEDRIDTIGGASQLRNTVRKPRHHFYLLILPVRIRHRRRELLLRRRKHSSRRPAHLPVAPHAVRIVKRTPRRVALERVLRRHRHRDGDHHIRPTPENDRRRHASGAAAMIILNRSPPLCLSALAAGVSATSPLVSSQDSESLYPCLCLCPRIVAGRHQTRNSATPVTGRRFTGQQDSRSPCWFLISVSVSHNLRITFYKNTVGVDRRWHVGGLGYEESDVRVEDIEEAADRQ